MPVDPELRAHQEWLGYVQPVGLVVSAAALAASQVFVDRNIAAKQKQLVDLLETLDAADSRLALVDLPRFCREFLDWEAGDLAGGPGGPPLPNDLEVVLSEYGERLAPTYAVPDPAAGGYLLLIQSVAAGHDLNAPPASSERGWHASPQARFERLLRETGVAQGVLCNGTSLRLVYAPRHESSGHLSFELDALAQVAGRPLVSALHMLLGASRLFSAPTAQRLPALLRESRRYQNQVSTQLAEQVQAALLELLRGFQSADAAAGGALLGPALTAGGDVVYGGLLSSLLRLVFLLYAEDRGLMPQDPVWVQHYSVGGLWEKLRSDAARNPDSMDQRYGAWPRLLTLFRLVFEGGAHARLRLPARRGRLFDPDAYPFLEGRAPGTRFRESPSPAPPRVADGVLLRVLEKLLVLDGERLSYRALDVEQIGSVYEAVMGFRLERARGPALALRPDHVLVDLEALLEVKPAERAKHLKQAAGCSLAGEAQAGMREAQSIDALVAALARRISPHTPRVLPAGALYLQPTEERRRSGSHYTPRALTEPIVRTTLGPLLERLGPSPRPEQILGLAVCDPAMGSGAFLVEACRFLASALVDAWERHGDMPEIPPDEQPQLHAQRLVAQRCLYGVDRNPFAVDLAKLSLWLATLARDHPFTFLDHALRCGDTLVGLSRESLASFHWNPAAQRQVPMLRAQLDARVRSAVALRARIAELAESDDTHAKAKLLGEAEAALGDLRLTGDLVVSAFFAESTSRAREAERSRLEGSVELWLGGKNDGRALADAAAELRRGERPLVPFHWPLEFPEVFARDNPGFDAFVGNPPFAGKNTIIAGNREGYLPWLQELHAEAHGNADLVAHFYRRAFELLRRDGAFGLIATNTIAQGDTRESGLRWICTHGGTIYAARKRLKWPGLAAVVVSVVHVAKGEGPARRELDDRAVERITAYLFHDGGHESPIVLAENAGKSFQGSIVLGMGFTFDDENEDATPLAEMQRLIEKDPRNRERIFPYIGGEELNDHPSHAHRRYVIGFGEMSEAEARRWPELMRIVEERVRTERLRQNDAGAKEKWWQFIRPRPELHAAIQGLERVLACSRHQPNWCVGFLPTGVVYAESLVLFTLDSYSAFCVLQSRPHELWARFFGSSMKDDLRYTPSDCFETFPFPPGWQASAALEQAGRAYYESRADWMREKGEGLTRTYNRFHDPDETSAGIARLRDLHAAMDRAVLDTYGWSELAPGCEFLLDYEEEEGEGGPSRRRKPWRLRWPDALRDEVLARLLALNRERAASESRSGRTAEARSTKRAKRSTSKKLGPLFD